MPLTQEALECVILGAKLRERDNFKALIRKEIEWYNSFPKTQFSANYGLSILLNYLEKVV